VTTRKAGAAMSITSNTAQVPWHSSEYCSCFCEENCYKLAQKLVSKGLRTHVVVITSPESSTPIWFQRSAERPGAAVLWDYHVVVISDGLVYDLDTTLPYPCPFAEYSLNAFNTTTSLALPAGYRHLFLVMAAEDYLATFSSDRSHMARLTGVQYPTWPIIRGPGADKAHALEDFISPRNPNMVDLQTFILQFSSKITV